MDLEYWEQYYSQKQTNRENSLFSFFVLDYIRGKKRILELGCGNGRDSLFFEKNEFDVVAIDQVTGELEELRNKFFQKIEFITGDFTRLRSTLAILNKHVLFDCIYSRFTLHSISSQQEERLLQDIPLYLSEDGVLAIEARGLRNSLCGIGIKVEEDEFSVAYLHDNHYRRFINFDMLCRRLEENFKIIYAEEKEGFAPYNNENDIFFRIIAKKMGR